MPRWITAINPAPASPLIRPAAIEQHAVFIRISATLKQAEDFAVPDLQVNPANRSQLDPSFVTNRVLSWEFVGGLRMTDPATTPVAFTRGLLANGTWSAESGVYRDSGGHIGFLGGNVQFYPNLTEADKQLTLNNGRKGSAILQALPYNATNPPRVYATPPAGTGSLAGVPAERAP